MALNGESSSSGHHTKPLENGLPPAVSEKLELEETADLVGDGMELEEEEPNVVEIKVRSFNE